MRLPNFLVIGAARAGTTSLYHALAEHPEIFMPSQKEPQFFTEHWSRGLGYYVSLFEAATDQARLGEASVSYSYRDRPEVAARIARTLGEGTKIIYVVRQPAERAFSHYLYYRYTGLKESLPFAEAIEANPVYKEASRYGSWYRLYRSTFGAENVHVVCFEDLRDDTASVAANCYRFLGVDSAFVPSHTKPTNARFAARSELIYRAYRRFSLSTTRRRIEALIPELARPTLRNLVHRVLGTKQGLPSLSATDRVLLNREFSSEVRELSDLTGHDYGVTWGIDADH